MRLQTISLFLSSAVVLATACAAPTEGDDETSGAAAVSAAQDPPAPGKAIFDSDDDAGWKVTRSDSVYVQRFKIVGGEIYCESKTHVEGSIPAALKLLRSPWTWYGGAVDDFNDSRTDGHITYTLWPTGKLVNLPGSALDVGVHVSEDMSPPIKLADGGVRILIQLGIFGSGQAYIEMHPDADGSDGFEMIGRFAGVKSNYLPTEFFAKAHLGAEAGKPPFPFAQGGGFEGLRKAMTATAVAASTTTSPPR